MRWSKGGSRAATGGGDLAAPSTSPCPPEGDTGEAAQIQALLQSLSRVRLAVSADLSAAAGALEDDRPDIAADVIAGARAELAALRAGVKTHPEPAEPALPAPRQHRTGRLARALAGAAALAVVIAVVPQVTGGSSHPSTGAARAEQPLDVRLASSDFSLLRERLLAANAAPAAILAASRSWQGAVARNLPNAGTNIGAASAVVSMLREERTLLLAAPALRLPANRSVAATLADAPDSLLAQLRQLASPQVLAILPAVVSALPVPVPSLPGAPKASVTPVPSVTAPSSSGTGSGAGPTVSTPPTAGATTAPAPEPTTLPLPLPSKLPPLPLPSSLGQLTGGSGQDGGLGQTVGNVLSGLGLTP